MERRRAMPRARAPAHGLRNRRIRCQLILRRSRRHLHRIRLRRRHARLTHDRHRARICQAPRQRHISFLARPLLVAKGSKGYAACAYVSLDAADKFGEACVIFSGVATHEAFLDATVAKVSKAAKALGVKDGMPGRDALALIR